MSIEMNCPGCGAPYKLSDSLEGKKVRCKKCDRTFLVEAPAEAAIDEPEEEGEELRVTAKTRSGRIAARPAGRSRFADDEEDDRPRPRRRPKKFGNNALIWILGGVAAAVLILCGGGVAVYVALTRAAARALAEQAQAAQAAVPPAPAAANPVPQPAPGGPQPAPGQVPPAGQPQPVPPQPQPGVQNNQPAIVLSNGHIGRGFGRQKSFSMSYRFEKGGPAPGAFYFVVIKSPRGQGEARFGWHEMQNQGVFELRELGFGGANDTGPYEAYVELGNLPGRFGQRTKISNTIPLTP